MRIGIGSDIHRLAGGRPLMIGGIEIPSEKGEAAHSDGDVLIHAIIDAILGATASGDIGALYPDTSPETEGMDSAMMLGSVIRDTGVRIINLDTTVNLEKPKLRPYIDAIRARLSDIIGIPVSSISVKAKTAEGLGPIGKGLAVSAEAIVLIE